MNPFTRPEISETTSLTPADIVRELDRYIIGQEEAKRAVAIALRNRWRRRRVPSHLQEEILPKNIIMIGPTGVGKTEIARRLARLAEAPFIKVEASKFTEVGYVGRNVESIIRELTSQAVSMVKKEEEKSVMEKAKAHAEEQILDLLLPPPGKQTQQHPADILGAAAKLIEPGAPAAAAADKDESPGKTENDTGDEAGRNATDILIEAVDKLGGIEPEETTVAKDQHTSHAASREKLRKLLKKGKLDRRFVEIDARAGTMPVMQVASGEGIDEMILNIQDMLGSTPFGRKKKKRKVTVPEALEILREEEASRLIDMETVVSNAIRLVEQEGIVFLDELDKIAGRESGGKGPDVSREGVQRDLLPIIEGSTVNTKFGIVKTEHILFIAAGAFHVASVSDLIPEIQGRFPIRVELSNLGKDDFVRILTETENSLIIQYTALLETEQVSISFNGDAVEEISSIAVEMNKRTINIGARRLHAVMEKLLDQVSYHAPDMPGQEIAIDADYVRRELSSIMQDEDLSRYIL